MSSESDIPSKRGCPPKIDAGNDGVKRGTELIDIKNNVRAAFSLLDYDNRVISRKEMHCLRLLLHWNHFFAVFARHQTA